MVSADEQVLLSGSRREGLQLSGRTGFHVEELVSFWDLSK
jgi:hypothetical protein